MPIKDGVIVAVATWDVGHSVYVNGVKLAPGESRQVSADGDVVIETYGGGGSGGTDAGADHG